MALIRTALLGGLVYLAFVVAFPNWTGQIYHVMALSCIAGGAVGVWFLRKILDLGGGAAKIVLELAFLAGVALFLGLTLPQKSGKTPFEQWAAGGRPTVEAARRGLRRLGVELLF